jgi:hypothetical protein
VSGGFEEAATWCLEVLWRLLVMSRGYVEAVSCCLEVTCRPFLIVYGLYRGFCLFHTYIDCNFSLTKNMLGLCYF